MEYEGWAIVELMGHRRYGGEVSEVEMYGAKLLRLDVYPAEGDDPAMTQYYSASAIYCITPATEDIARQAGEMSLPRTPPPYLIEAPGFADVETYD